VLAAEKELGEERKTPYELASHLIGCASGGPPDLSVRTGEKFRQILREKASRR